MMKKVLIVGANGYLGSKLSLTLAHRGYKIVAFVDRRFPYDNLKGIENISIEEFLLEEIDKTYDLPLLKDTDTLYHFAWAGVNAKCRNESETQVKNVEYGIKVLEFAEHHQINKVVVPGSAAEVSCGNGIITGNEIPAPSDMYSAAKVATRFVCQTYAQQHGIDLIWTLITSIYGPMRNDNNLISYCIESLLKGKKPLFTGLEQKWDYLHVEDLMEALILIGEKGQGGKVYPIGSGEHKQMREYIEIIRRNINPHAQIGIGELPYKNPYKIDNQIIDISELQKDTDFKPRWKFEDGIIPIIEDLKNTQI